MRTSSSTTARSLRTSNASGRSSWRSMPSSIALRPCTEWVIGGIPRTHETAERAMKSRRVALGIRAQLLLVLTVFLAIPWLGYEYVRELERFLRDAQEKTLAGTAQAVATALHDRPRLFDVQPARRESLSVERSADGAAESSPAIPSRASAPVVIATPGAEIAQIIQGLSR